MYYISSFVRPSIQTPHHFKLVENTLALPTPNEVKPGEKTNKNNKKTKKIPLKPPKKPQHKTTLKPEQRFITLSGETWIVCFFFMCWWFLHYYVETCLKNAINLCAPIKFECLPPCTAETFGVDKTEDTCCLRIMFLVFRVADILFFGVFLRQACPVWGDTLIFFFSLHLYTSLVFFFLLHILNPRIWTSSVENSDMYKT